MKHYGVSLGEVLAVTRNMNRNANGGVLYEYDNEYIIRGVLSTANAEEIGKGVVKIVGDFPVLLENIATVKIGSKSPKLGTASERAKPAVLITVTKQPNTSTIDQRTDSNRHPSQTHGINSQSHIMQCQYGN